MSQSGLCILLICGLIYLPGMARAATHAVGPRGLGCLAIGGRVTPLSLATHALLADAGNRNVAIVRLPLRTRKTYWVSAVRDDFSPYWLDTRWHGTPVLDIDPYCRLTVNSRGRLRLDQANGGMQGQPSVRAR